MLTRNLTSGELTKELVTTGFADRHPSVAAMVLRGGIPYFERRADGTEVAIKIVPSPAQPSSALPERRDRDAVESLSASADLARSACAAAGVALPSFESHSSPGRSSDKHTSGASASAELADAITRAAKTGAREPETLDSASADIAAAAMRAAGGARC